MKIKTHHFHFLHLFSFRKLFAVQNLYSQLFHLQVSTSYFGVFIFIRGKPPGTVAVAGFHGAIFCFFLLTWPWGHRF